MHEKPDFDQRISQIPNAKKVIFTAQQNVFHSVECI
jgi:hypothetical protein